MNILIISDKFKFTFSSREIGNVIANVLKIKGIKNINVLPISDGGEGFIDVISSIYDVKFVSTDIYDALLRKKISNLAIFDDTAYIESAKTIGLQLLSSKERNPFYTSSYGLGEQIKEAIRIGARKIVVGLGGSATNDGGIGMASALGYIFYDKQGNELLPIGENLIKIYKVEKSKILPKVEITGACDVNNPLLGLNGASFSFAEQKGANREQILILEEGLKNLKEVLIRQKIYSGNVDEYEGSAGGLGFGIKAFLNGKLVSGSDYVFNLLRVEKQIKNADFIITGEGKLDEQTFNGKIVGEIINIVKKYKKSCLVIAGYSELNKPINGAKIISLFDNKIDIETAKRETKTRIEKIDFNKLLK